MISHADVGYAQKVKKEEMWVPCRWSSM